MNAADDPYFNWLEMMRREGAAAVDAPYLIGTVLSVSPLKVQVGELEIERKRLKINSFLLTGYARRWNLALTDAIGQTDSQAGGGHYEAFSAHAHGQETIGVPDGTFTTLDDFFVGDEVLLLRSADGQQYILICKLL